MGRITTQGEVKRIRDCAANGYTVAETARLLERSFGFVRLWATREGLTFRTMTAEERSERGRKAWAAGMGKRHQQTAG